eukprot:657919-Pelagomonas_calceolata.AAC.2
MHAVGLELRSLTPWNWDTKAAKHPPGKQALRDFERVRPHPSCQLSCKSTHLHGSHSPTYTMIQHKKWFQGAGTPLSKSSGTLLPAVMPSHA